MAIDYAALEPETQAFLRSIFRQPQVGPKLEKPKPRGPSEEKMTRPEDSFMRIALLAEAAGHLKEFKYHPDPYEILGVLYFPDFELVASSGGKIVVETKGKRMVGDQVRTNKLRQCSQKWPEHRWWLARWSPKLPWRVQEIVGGVIRRKAVQVEWLS